MLTEGILNLKHVNAVNTSAMLSECFQLSKKLTAFEWLYDVIGPVDSMI